MTLAVYGRPLLRSRRILSFWRFGWHSQLQILKLITVQLGVDCGLRRKKLEIDDALKIPPNSQHNFVGCKLVFGCESKNDLLTLASMVNRDDPLLVTGNDLLKKSVSTTFQQQKGADGVPLLDVLLRQLV